MDKDKWLLMVSRVLGFDDGFPDDLMPMAEQLYKQGSTTYEAEQWFIKALWFMSKPNA